jgi:Tol biopolymer transport system component
MTGRLLLAMLVAACSSAPGTPAPGTLAPATSPAVSPVPSGVSTAGAATAPPATPSATTAIPVVAPGEPWIVYQSGIEQPLRLVRPDGSDDHLLLPSSPGTVPGHPAWSPDGKSIAYDVYSPHPATPGKDHVAVWLVDVGTRIPTELASCDLPCLQLAYPAWSPDGTEIALMAYEITQDGEWARSILQILEVASGERRDVVASDDGLTGYYTPRWSPDGRRLVFTIETYEDVSEEVVTGSAIALVAADGSEEPKVLTDPALYAGEPDWAPSNRIVFGVGREKHVDANLMTIEADGSDLTPLTSFDPGEGRAIEGTWLPGGDRLMFVSGGTTGLCRIGYVDGDGTGLEVATWSLQSAPGCAERTHAHLRPR